MISLPPYMLRWARAVGYLVPGQVQDYYAEPPKDGLASHAPGDAVLGAHPLKREHLAGREFARDDPRAERGQQVAVQGADV